jgi:hypothetical protein
MTASSSQSRCMRGTGTSVPASALMTLNSRSTAWAEGSNLAAGPGLERMA